MSKSLVTAKDVAKKCNVSQATVSYVINNKEGKTSAQLSVQKFWKLLNRWVISQMLLLKAFVKTSVCRLD